MTYAEQDRHYRIAARDRGCTCPDLPAHVHLLDCPLYVVPGGVPGGLHDHELHEELDKAHDADEGRPWL